LTYTTGHRGKLIEVQGNINTSPAGGAYSRVFFNQTSVPPNPLGNCTNVNCHFEAATSSWGSPAFNFPADCTQCHGIAPATGNHPVAGSKHGSYYGTGTGSCQKCHPDHTAAALPFRHASSAANRGIAVQFTTYPNSGGSYSGDGRNFLPSQHKTTFGTCSNLYCHSDGNGGGPNVVPTWGGSLDCSGCHDGDATTAQPMASGKHTAHISTTPAAGLSGYGFICERCHKNTVTGNTAISDRTHHVNGVKDVAFKDGGTYDMGGKGCTSTYCHSDALGGPPTIPVKWSDTNKSMQCFSCHKGRTFDNTTTNCRTIGGTWGWDAVNGVGYCTPYVNMTSNGHAKLVGPRWIRQYPCTYCHNATVAAATDANGKITDNGIIPAQHMNNYSGVMKVKIAMHSQWNIVGRPNPTYDPGTKVCNNVYCHSDGTTNPDTIREFPWNQHGTECNSCHGHPRGSCMSSGCHDGRTDSTGNVWTLPAIYLNVTSYRWPAGQEWKAAMPMYTNQGAGTAKANSHARHLQTNFTCDTCHAATIRSSNGTTSCYGMGCHTDGQPIPAGSMRETPHLNGDKHVNKAKDLVFKPLPDGTGNTAGYDHDKKTCSNTSTTGCHGAGGTDPQWGGSVNSTVICLSCHGTTGPSVESFTFKNFSSKAKINLTNWATNGHGRPASAGPYPVSNNPAANFPGNPCWYCHDNNVIHNDSTNPYRLRQHQQFVNRFQKECVYCHMVGTDSECLSCHNSSESLSPQLSAIFGSMTARWPDGTQVTRPDHSTMTNGTTSCITSQCHYVDPANPTNDVKRHNTGAGLWTTDQQNDVKNQYLMMGVCLKCHDDDSGGKCTTCHTAPANNPLKYTIGFKAYSGFPLIKPQKARASSAHFGHKHYYQDFLNSGGWTKVKSSTKSPIFGTYSAYKGTWKGGKFCWDCHNPHGDTNVSGQPNIYMIRSQVATSTDGWLGIPKTRASVVFTKKQSGLDYAKITAPYNGICNVCHAQQSSNVAKHYGSDYGDGHNASRTCTSCHEHRFTDSHADNQPCNSCHMNKPVPRHSAFGQPRDCTKCHAGTIGMRMDIMGQMNANSHHVQGNKVTNKQCYACHWESTPEGLIDVRYHLGYNYKLYTSVKNAPSQLVVWKPGLRPTYYNSTTAVSFLASNVGTANERSEVAKLTNVCLSCHSDQNNNTQPFNDCKTPRQYAWDGQSIAARYSQTGTTQWGKYNSSTYPKANQKDKVTKAFSAHGNAANNQGGYSITNGVDSAIPNTRGGGQNVQCYDCHSSHGSKVVGTTSSYVTFNGTNNGANLKQTQAGKGGYSMTYQASASTTAGAVNPYNAGAGQCFDCHLTQNAGTTPWGYQSTFGATAPIKGYFDSAMFGTSAPGVQQRYPLKGNKSVVGGHLHAETMLNYTTSAQNKINGLCTPCHDPHGVSPTLGAKQAYAVPMLKGTWMTSPYKEDSPQTSLNNPPEPAPDYNTTGSFVFTDQNTFNGSRITEDVSQFAGLCLRCHYQKNLTNGTDHTWKSRNRVHEAVKGWKTADTTIQHSYTCSKCHTPHTSGLPRLMITNCLDYKHRGGVTSGGQAGHNSNLLSGSGLYLYNGSFPKGPAQTNVNCHPNATWPDNSWNNVTPWTK
jgi:predicted CxxxxCH...CXXCH cytochrome family protein